MKTTSAKAAFLVCCVTGFLLAEDIFQQVRVYYSEPSDLRELSKTGIPLDHVRIRKGVFIDVVATKRQVAELKKKGFRVEILQDDLIKFFQQRFDRKLKREDGFRLGSMGGNYTYDEMVAELDSLQRSYPSLVSEKVSIGRSVEGRDIWAVKISDNVEQDENVGLDYEPQVLYTALTHAREPVGMMNLIYLMVYLCENYPANERVASIVNNRELWFVPCVNPDGYVYNETEHPEGGGLHRKNRRDTGCGDGTDRGVDLNRNFSFNWGSDDVGSSPDSCHNTFRGRSAFSEPETSVLDSFMMSKNFKNVLHYHTFSNLLIHSYSNGDYPPEPDLSMLREYGAEMTRFNNYRVGTGPETVGYLVNGDAVDYSYGTLGFVAYTPEIGSFDDNFWPPTERIIPLCQENVHPNLYFARIAGSVLDVSDVSMGAEYPQPGDSAAFNFKIRNVGLRPSLGSVTVTLSPLKDVMDFEPFQADVGTINERDTVDFPYEVIAVVDSSISAGCPAGVVVQMDDSGYETYTDTISFLVGTPALIMADDAESGMDKWITESWGLSTTRFEGNHSITDSPDGNYSTNTVSTLVLGSPLDLSEASHARLTFWAKWDIEKSFDFLQIQASTDGNIWTPLSGRHTRGGSGEGQQPRGEPGYEGFQPDWVPESVDLSGFDGQSEVYIRFVLMSDEYGHGDGFYIDDVKIKAYPVSEIAKGDVTRDCETDVGDILKVVDMILVPETATALERQIADLNNDDRVDVSDIVDLVDVILGK